MPLTATNRQLITAETTLWNALSLLNEIENAGQFNDRLEEICGHVDRLASEMKEYNEQSESEPAVDPFEDPSNHM